MNWHRSRAVRRSLGHAGTLLAASGLLAVAAVVPPLGRLSLVWPPIVAFAGIWTVGRLARAGGLTRPGFARDLLLTANALIVGGAVETLHVLGVVQPALFHLTLAGSFALIGAFLLTAGAHTSPQYDDALEGVRFGGYVFLLAAIVRAFVVGVDQIHEFPANLSMALLFLAGIVLAREAPHLSRSALEARR